MQTIWATGARTQTQTSPCGRCLAVALSRTLRGRTLDPGMRRYIQSVSFPGRTTSRHHQQKRSLSHSAAALSLSPSPLSLSPSPFSTTINTLPRTKILRQSLITTTPFFFFSFFPNNTPTTPIITKRSASSSSKSRWKQRQGSDHFAREARVQGLKSRAAFKLLEMDSKYKLFKKSSGQIVVDLGFAPGSWSQVALERTKPDGYVLGIDLIPAQPPKGMNTIQGNFLSPGVQGMVKGFLLEEEGRRREVKRASRREKKNKGAEGTKEGEEEEEKDGGDETVKKEEGEEIKVEVRETKNVVVESTETTAPEEAGEGETETGTGVITEQPSYIDMERAAARESGIESGRMINPATGAMEAADLLALKEKKGMRLVDVVLSDMSAPWPQTSGFSVKSLSNPYNRMMNTSGIPFRDHIGSMDLCKAALSFASDTLKPGGHFVCKFYQGGEDKDFENKLKKMFAKVHREKPDSSRSESRESFFVALRRKPNVTFEDLGME